MNLSKSPTQDQLKALLSACDDNAGHHVIWASPDGEVHITLLEDEMPADFAQRMGNKMKFRFETRDRGNGYVGPAAAQDSEYVRLLLRDLTKSWQDDDRGYIDA